MKWKMSCEVLKWKYKNYCCDFHFHRFIFNEQFFLSLGVHLSNITQQSSQLFLFSILVHQKKERERRCHLHRFQLQTMFIEVNSIYWRWEKKGEKHSKWLKRSAAIKVEKKAIGNKKKSDYNANKGKRRRQYIYNNHYGNYLR